MDTKLYNYSPFLVSRVLEMIMDIYHYRRIAKNNYDDLDTKYKTILETNIEEIKYQILNQEDKQKNQNLKDTLNFLETFKDNNNILFFENTLQKIIECTVILTSKTFLKEVKDTLNEITFELNTFEKSSDKKEMEEFNKSKVLILKELNNSKTQEKLLDWYYKYRLLVDRAVINELCYSEYMAYVGDLVIDNKVMYTYNLRIAYEADKDGFSEYCTFGLINPTKTIFINNTLDIVNEHNDYSLKLKQTVYDFSSIDDSVSFIIDLYDKEDNQLTSCNFNFELKDFITLYTLDTKSFVTTMLEIINTKFSDIYEELTEEDDCMDIYNNPNNIIDLKCNQNIS